MQKNTLFLRKCLQMSKIIRNFAADLEQKPMDRWRQIWAWLRRYVLNKYVLTLAVFALILTFCGEQSLLKRAQRAHEISEKEDELRAYRQAIEETNAQIERMNASTENLEQFAREQYYMHADNEDVYIVNEP